MKKDNKQRLFEVMGKLDATFKPRLNEVDAPVNPNANNPNASANPNANNPQGNPQGSENPQEDNKIKEFLKKQLNILDWESQEGLQKRKQIADSVLNIAAQVEGAVKSSISGPEKAAKVQTLLTGTGILSTLIGLWRLLSNTHTVTYGIFEKFSNWVGGGEALTNHIEWGGVFFLKVAAFLLILKVVHKLLYKGTVLKNDIGGIWNYIRSIISALMGKSTKVQESTMSIDEDRIIREMLAYEI